MPDRRDDPACRDRRNRVGRLDTPRTAKRTRRPVRPAPRDVGCDRGGRRFRRPAIGGQLALRPPCSIVVRSDRPQLPPPCRVVQLARRPRRKLHRDRGRRRSPLGAVRSAAAIGAVPAITLTMGKTARGAYQATPGPLWSLHLAPPSTARGRRDRDGLASTREQCRSAQPRGSDARLSNGSARLARQTPNIPMGRANASVRLCRA
jgi:hypothetical protein